MATEYTSTPEAGVMYPVNGSGYDQSEFWEKHSLSEDVAFVNAAAAREDAQPRVNEGLATVYRPAVAGGFDFLQ